MAKTTTLAAVFLCLFAAALARVEPITDDTTSTAVSLPIATTSTEIVNGETQSKTEITATVTPVINYHFNPIKRRFRVGSKFPCHHRRHTERKEISYGNDMLVANPSENSDLPKPEIERNPWNWMKLHHHHHHHEAESDSDSDSDDEGAEIERKSWMKLYHHHHHHEAEIDSDSDDEGEDKKVFTRRDWTDQVVSDGKSEIKQAVPFHHHRHHHHRRHREEKKGGFMKLVSDFVHNHF